MTRTKDIQIGMKFDNFGETLEVIAVRKVEGGVIVQWSGWFGNEFVADDRGIDLVRA